MEEQDRAIASLFGISVVQFFVLGFLFLALLHGQRDLTVLALLVLVMISGARLWTWKSLSRLKCHLTVDKRKIFPGEKIILRISVENAKLLPIWVRVSVAARGLADPSTSEWGLTKDSILLWHQRAYFEWELTAER